MNQGLPAADADLVILGGGCAGLSLAVALIAQAPQLSFAVVEPRVRYGDDRTWCGWRTEPHLFSDCVAAQSETWRIITPAEVQCFTSRAYPYEVIRSISVYQKALRLIQASSSAVLRSGVEAAEMAETSEGVRVQLSDGTVLRSPWVIDTRPQGRVLAPPWLWQNFVGYVIRDGKSADAAGEIPTLMDFQAARGCPVQFVYQIPLGDGSCLFECTRFSAVGGEADLLEAELLQWLHQRIGRDWTVQRKETGSLPMAPPLPTPYRRVIPAGTRGGSMRISTGYAFHRIQRWAHTCARSLQTSGIPVPPERIRRLDLMDELFLRVLRDPGTSAATLFGNLFRECPTDSLIRFLSGIPRGSDLWQVMRGLPWGRFLRTIPALAGSRRSPIERPTPC